MQAQANRTEAKTISSAQSLAAVQTLLRAGLGCITFMRDLLPQDNFTESHFTSTDDSCMSQTSSNSTFSSPAKEKKNVNGFKIMTMSRGYTDEADRILNYLEYGIFDALQKQYLKSFIFALYLDNNDPNNIVEAYTFNFQYHTIIGTNIVVPVMSLNDDMRRMSLKGKDPVAEAAKRGAIPTLRDVKRSVKTLLKTLITSMTQMDVLPKRRYATFKVFYTDDTPSDYEPPHFKAGDYEKDKWYFATHDMEEVPDNWSVGRVNAGWHEVDVSVSSIATYLPSSTEHDNQPFGGTVTRSVALVPPSLTPAGEIALRAEEIKKQIVDANSRRVVWAAEDEPKEETDTSGVGGKGPDIVRKPIGIKNDNGEIRCLVNAEETFEERHYYGPSPIAPLGLKDIQRPINSTPTSDFPQTQLVNDSDVEDNNFGEDSHTNSGPRLMRRQESTVSEAFSMSTSFAGDSVLDTPTPYPTTRKRIDEVISRSPSPDSFMTPDDTRLGSRTVSIEMGVSDNESRGIEANALMEKLALSYDGGMDDIEDEEMLDLETQVVEAINPQLIEIQLPDPIQSFDSSKALPTSDRAPPSASSFIPVAHKIQVQKPKDDVVDCECGIQEEDECCSCEGGCDKWYHIWCMGYHSVQDPRLPEQFICFNCRLRADPSWELIKVELYSSLIIKFRELASFRRALKVAEKHSPLTAVEFAQAMGCENTQARQLIKRLETEGFIAEETTTTDEIGFVQTRAKTMKGKGKSAKQTKPRRGLQKQRFVFNLKSVRCQEYKDYFDPSPEVESRLLGIPQTRASLKARNTTARDPSRPEPFPQTQSAQSQTQDDPEETFTLKRPPEVNTDDSLRRKKKVKISITRGVDLAE